MVKTRRMALIAILSALSFVLMLVSFPIIPGADFLKIDFSIIPILFGLVMLDLRSAYTILVLRTLLKLLLNNRGVNDVIGLPMNMVALGLFVAAFALIWKEKESLKTFVLASLVGTVSLTLAMIGLNLVFAIPLYAKFANFDINQFIGLGKYMLYMVLPFNLVEGVLFSLVFAGIYASLRPVLVSYRYEK